MVSGQKGRMGTVLMALLIIAIPIRGQGTTEIQDQTIGSQSSSADACVPRPLGLLAWWPGDNSAVDLVGGRNGSAEGGTGFAPGRVGQGFLLPPGSRIVVTDDSTWTLADKPFTYEAWVNFESLEQRTPIVGHDEGAGERNKWILWYDAIGHRSPSGPALRFHVNSPVVSPLDPIVYPWEPDLHRWYHLAITRDGNTYALYIDGARVITEVDSHTIPDPEAPLTIGEAEGFSFHGLIDELGFYGRALSAQEIEELFLAGSAGKCKTGPRTLVALCRSAEVFTRPGTCSSEASIDGGSFDAGGGEISLSAEPPPPYDLGDTPVVLRIEGSQPAPCNERPDGLIGWWPADGDAVDIVGGNDGSLENGTTFAPGMVGGAFVFDGIDDVVRVPESADLDLPVGHPVTIEGWAFSSSPSVLQHLLGKRAGCGNDFDFYQLAIGNLAIPRSAVPLNEWVHLAWASDPSAGVSRHYVNGIEVSSNSILVGTNDADLTFGNSGNCAPFRGMLDEIAIYDRPLSPTELSVIVDAGEEGFCKPRAGQGDGTPTSSTCEATVSVVDPDPPSVECNAEPLLVFSGETELRFMASSGDNCENTQGVSIRILEASCIKSDFDGDGIPDDEDECPGGDVSELLRIDDCETGINNFLLDSGCTFADLILECAEDADNHGAYVSCVALLANEWKARGWISGSERGVIQACAAKSPIPLSASGKRGLETPRRYDLGSLVDDGERSRCDVTVEGLEIVVPDPPRSGLIRWEVVADDGSGNSTTRSCMVTVQDPELPVSNQRPVADAGSGQHVLTLEIVTLDGGKSRDLEGRPLSYIWKLTSVPVNSTATLSDPTGIHPSFTADRPGTYEVQLVVNDGELDSLPAVVRVTAQNARPIARAGMDQEVFLGTTVQLVGSDSFDPEGNAVRYLWNVALRPEGSTATLSDPQAASPSFVADAHGDFVIQLVVNDGELSSLVDAVRVTVLNRPPLADAGSDQSAFRSEPVELDGRSSVDPDGDFITFFWRLVSRPTGSTAVLSNGTEAVVVLVADLPGEYVAELVVSDGIDTSEADTVTLTAINRLPTADAGPDQTVFSRETVRLDASLSADADGDSLTYWWEFVSVPSGSNAVLSDPTAVTPTFVPDLTGSYVVRLLVSDSFNLSTPDETMVTVINSPPVANAGADQRVIVGATVLLEGERSFDIDGDPITFHWSVLSFPAGSAVALSDPDSVNPTFVADEVGMYQLQLIVNDGQIDSEPDVVSIEVSIPLVTVPDVVKLNRDEAEALLLLADLAIGSVEQENSANVPKGAVIRQAPSSGVEVPAGTSVDLVISSGPSILIRVPKLVLRAGEALEYSVEFYDHAGELVVPTPVFEVELDVKPDELSGTLPALSGASVLTAPDTRGAFSLRITVPATSQSATLELVVTSDHAEMVPYSDLSAALISVDEDLGILAQAATDDDFALVDSLLAELTATRDAVDLEALRRSVPIALDVGFPPTLDQVIAAGYSETADDAVLFSLAGEIIEQMMTTEALVDQLDPDSADDIDQLKLLNRELESLANQFDALSPTVYGIIKSSSRLSHLVSVRIPRLLRTLVDRVAAIGEMEIDGSLTNLNSPHLKLDFVGSLAGVAISAQLQVRIIQQLYVPIMKEIGKSALIMAAADLISYVVNSGTLDAVITGGSQSFQIFDAPFSAIEGVGFDVDFVDGNDVYIIGPDAIDACLEILNEAKESLDILGDIADVDEIADLPITVKNAFDLKAKFDEIKDVAVAAWNQANAEPDDVVQGCLFNLDPACHQLIFTDGFRSVHSTGFLPAPVLVIVRNVSDSGFGTLVVNFIPKTDSAE